jgi:hypothetical protein
MPLPAYGNKNTNTSASAVVLRAQTRVAFASAVQQQQAINQGCVRVSIGASPATNKDASVITDVNTGANFTTQPEYVAITINGCK